MKQSPILNHAIESFEHGLQHYLDGTPRSRKFALLHIDQAIELVLKERAVQLGKSIYKSDGTTLTIHETFSSLKQLSIPERPRLEELHDLRNTVQHKGLTPDSDSTRFYVEVAYNFFKRFLDHELNTPLDQAIPTTYRALMEGQPVIETSEVITILQSALRADSPAEKILTGFTALNRLVDLISDPAITKSSFRGTLRKAAEARGVGYKELKLYLADIMRLRNEIIHSDYEPTDEEAQMFFSALEGVFKSVGLDWKQKLVQAK